MSLIGDLQIFALFCCTLFLASECQNGNGTLHVMQKTSFSCAGRPAGYYADVETGCQVYHMCDGLGRQFSYTCPNTTLFQQRMLICDHWYMVNCSKAESNYAANLLIGQRDKPFVNDEENNLRTPRPDLLDRPYAPDYSGESFRSQYKQLTAVQNQIRDDADKSAGKPLQSGQHWRIPPPSRTILPPAYEPQIEELAASTNTHSSTTTEATPVRQTMTTRRSFRFVAATPPKRNEALPLHARQSTIVSAGTGQGSADMEDLGTSHSTRYNTSADFNSAEQPVQKILNTTKVFVKTPSKIYEPPFLYPIYNLEEEQQPSTLPTLRTSTAAPFSTTPTRQSTLVGSFSSTARPISRPTTFAGLPFSTAATPPPTPLSLTRPTLSSAATATALRAESRTPTPAQSFRLASPTPSAHTQSRQQKPQLPLAELLPPFVDFVPHDIATTQGPPIYYEWKIPSNGLEPPKFEAPFGVDGREYPETINDYTSNSFNGQSQQDIFNIKLNDIASGPLSFAKAQHKQSSSSSTRLPSARSIKADADVHNSPSTEKAQRRADVLVSEASASSTATDIVQLRKQLLVPEYAFPLETIGRTGYGSGDVYNSFLLKIPTTERRTNGAEAAATKRHWFGENPKCPECHPSFVLPGTCEPCLRR